MSSCQRYVCISSSSSIVCGVPEKGQMGEGDPDQRMNVPETGENAGTLFLVEQGKLDGA